MRHGPWLDDQSRLRAASTRGVISARHLEALGVPETTAYRRCRDGGPWQRPLPGIMLLFSGQATREQQLTAALLHAGPGAIITGLEACRRYGIRRGPGPRQDEVHLLLDHARHVKSAGFALIERTHRLPEPVLVDGFPLAPVPRACTDAARRLRPAGEVAELFADAVQRGLCTVGELRQELDDSSRKGSSTPRRVLREVSEGIRSAAELEAKKLVASTGLPEPWWNVRIHDARGRLLGIADCWWDTVAMVWEIESTAWHLSPADHDRSVARAGRFAAAGALYIPTKPTELRSNRRGVRQILTDGYRQAATRPRPALQAIRSE